MAKRTTTIIVEPRLLVREGLESLIKNYHYRVVCSVGSIVEISHPTLVRDGPKLVVLGADSADDAVAAAVSIRKLWSNSKLVLLFDHASVADFQKVLMSEVDGCVPSFASPETLIKTLDLVTIEGAARVVVTASARRPAMRPSPKEHVTSFASGDGQDPVRQHRTRDQIDQCGPRASDSAYSKWLQRSGYEV
jgi:two-component system, NarL family, nitrate/nitrite response regulator NarL